MIDWEFAERVAARSARRRPGLDGAVVDELQASYARLTADAERYVTAETGLHPLGRARARVTDRPGWVGANVRSFERLLRPLTDKLDAREPSRLQPLVGKAGGAQLGLLLGWMSGRVLGQYDLLVVEDGGTADQDLVYYVGPNLLGMERRYAFPPEEFRLWVALHECTHRAQFTGVPWLRPYFIEQVHDLLGSVDPDGGDLVANLRRAVTEARSGRGPLDRGGLAALFATPQQQVVLDRLGGLMSLLEGHGEVVMNRAATRLIPTAWRFERVLKTRREAAGGLTRFLNRLLGFEAKLAQYAEGERFITAVERHGGRDLFDTVWEGPDRLPTLAEIRTPQRWIDRVTGTGPAA